MHEATGSRGPTSPPLTILPTFVRALGFGSSAGVEPRDPGPFVFDYSAKATPGGISHCNLCLVHVLNFSKLG